MSNYLVAPGKFRRQFVVVNFCRDEMFFCFQSSYNTWVNLQGQGCFLDCPYYTIAYMIGLGIHQ